MIKISKEMGQIGSSETLVLNHLTPRNNPEDGKNSSTCVKGNLPRKEKNFGVTCHAIIGKFHCILNI